jgi:hypothetical protein
MIEASWARLVMFDIQHPETAASRNADRSKLRGQMQMDDSF